MWRCKQCGELLEDQFDACWKCAGGKDESIQDYLRNHSQQKSDDGGPQSSSGDPYAEQDELLYLEATNEVDDGIIDKALWAKAMALCEGDEKRAKYKYVVLRVAAEKLKMTRSAEPSTNEPPTLQPLQPEVEIGSGVGICCWPLIILFIAFLGFLYMGEESPLR